MTGNLTSFFFLEKENKYISLCTFKAAFISINHYSVARAIPRIQSRAKPQWKQTISLQPFQQESLRTTDRMYRKNVWKLGKNVGKLGRNIGKLGVNCQHDYSTSARQRSLAVPAAQFLLFLRDPLEAAAPGVGGRKPQEVARSLWWCNCHIAPDLALLILARANHRANWAATTRSSSAFTSTAHPNEVWLKCNTLYQHTGWL